MSGKSPSRQVSVSGAAGSGDFGKLKVVGNLSSTRCGMEIIDYGGDLKNEITEVGDREQRDDFWG